MDKKFLGEHAEYHVGCEPQLVTFAEPGGKDAFAERIRRDLIEVIRWADGDSERSKQVEPGPSEIGNPCDRFLAYRIAGVPAVNTYTDPWPAIVGTAIHQWLESAFQRFQAAAGAVRWSTELTVDPDPLVKGHLDLFDHWEYMVCDWKSLGTTKLRQWRKDGPPDNNIDQVNLYAKGRVNAGHEVRKVCLIGIPRAGWLDDMIVWVDDYRPERAQRALDRLYRVGQDLLRLDVLQHPQRFADIPVTPMDNCSWCPYWRPEGRDKERPADLTGCNGGVDAG